MKMHPEFIANITRKQIEYITSLAIDLQFDLRQRNVHIISIIKRKVEYLDELTKEEASLIIGKFIEWKNKG